jgi:type IV pilus assembly protein PilM
MAEKVISIKIGNSITQVAEVDYKAKNPRVYHAFSFETPEGAIDDGGVHVTEELLDRFQRGMQDAGIKNDKAVFTTSSARVASRDVTIPLVKENKIRSLLLANSKEYFPVDLAEYQLVYRIIEKLKSEKQMKLTVYAVPNALLQSYHVLAKALGVTLVSMDYFGNSIYQAMINTMPKDLSALICIEDNYSLVTVIRDGQIALQRTISYGIDDAVNEFTEGDFARNGTGYPEALEQLYTNHYIGDSLHPANDDGQEIKRAVTQNLTMLIGNISRVLDYYFSRNTDVELSRISLVGLGAECIGLDRLLSNELDVYVESVRKFGSADVSKELAAREFHVAEYYGCIAAAIDPLDIRFVSEKNAGKGISMAVPALVCVVGLTASVALILSAYLSNMFVEMDNDDMRAEILSKQSAIETYNAYVTAKMINQEAAMIDTDSSTVNDVFLTFIDEMEEKMPKDLVVTSFTVSEGEGSMSLICGSKESAAETLMQLRSFKTILLNSASGITETTSDAGATEESFSVTFELTEIVEEVPEEMPAEEGTDAIIIDESAEGTTEGEVQQ